MLAIFFPLDEKTVTRPHVSIFFNWKTSHIGSAPMDDLLVFFSNTLKNPTGNTAKYKTEHYLCVKCSTKQKH